MTSAKSPISTSASLFGPSSSKTLFSEETNTKLSSDDSSKQPNSNRNSSKTMTVVQQSIPPFITSSNLAVSMPKRTQYSTKAMSGQVKFISELLHSLDLRFEQHQKDVLQRLYQFEQRISKCENHLRICKYSKDVPEEFIQVSNLNLQEKKTDLIAMNRLPQSNEAIQAYKRVMIEKYEKQLQYKKQEIKKKQEETLKSTQQQLSIQDRGIFLQQAEIHQQPQSQQCALSSSSSLSLSLTLEQTPPPPTLSQPQQPLQEQFSSSLPQKESQLLQENTFIKDSSVLDLQQTSVQEKKSEDNQSASSSFSSSPMRNQPQPQTFGFGLISKLQDVVMNLISSSSTPSSRLSSKTKSGNEYMESSPRMQITRRKTMRPQKPPERDWLSSLNRSPTRREVVINEMYSSEGSYFISLKHAVKLYQVPLNYAATSDVPILRPSEVSQIFSNLEVIYNISKELHSQLTKRLFDNAWDNSEQRIGDVLLTLIPFLKIYYEYTKCYDSSRRTIQRLIEINEEFKAFLEKTRSIGAAKQLDLPSLLIMPVQRLPRYVLLLTELKANTPDTHPDFFDICAALEMVKNVVNEMNNAIIKAENTNKLLEIQNNFGNSFLLLEPFRTFIKEGPVFYMHNQKQQKYNGSIFLCNDLILLAKKYLLTQGYSLEERIYLDVVVIDILPSNESFILASSANSYTLTFKNQEEKNEWMLNIVENKNLLQKRTGKLVSFSDYHSSFGKENEPTRAPVQEVSNQTSENTTESQQHMSRRNSNVF